MPTKFVTKGENTCLISFVYAYELSSFPSLYQQTTLLTRVFAAENIVNVSVYQTI